MTLEIPLVLHSQRLAQARLNLSTMEHSQSHNARESDLLKIIRKGQSFRDESLATSAEGKL